MKFEEWFKVEYPNQHVFKESTLTCKSFYDGASAVWDYKQAEIDAALKQRDSFIKAHHIAMNDVCDQKAEIDALQKRIDLIVDLVRDNTPDYYLDNVIQDILKGDKND